MASTQVRLTKREKEILGHVSLGLTDKAIGEALTISRRTVSDHLQHIYDKLQVNNRKQAVNAALRLGLIPSDALTQKDSAE